MERNKKTISNEKFNYKIFKLKEEIDPINAFMEANYLEDELEEYKLTEYQIKILDYVTQEIWNWFHESMN